MIGSTEAAFPQTPSALPLDDASVPKRARSVLDLGCGDGATILRAMSAFSASDKGITRFVCGVDTDMDALRALKVRAPHIQCVRASGEQLPFKAGCFDYAISGVALPYMDVPRTLREVCRVLRPEGQFWASLHRPLVVWSHLLVSIRTLNWKDMLFRTYVLTNACSLHVAGKIFRFPLNRKRIESGQTRRGMSLALHSAGFTDIVMNQGRNRRFVVTAKRGSLS